MEINTKEYPIGTIYQTRGKYKKICTIVDILKTYNSKNELVRIRYISTYLFLGQLVYDRDVIHTTVTMGVMQYAKNKEKI